MNCSKTFSKHQLTKIGIITAVAYLIIFSFVWLTAYHGVMERTSHLKIGIVNQDTNTHVMKKLTQNLNFENTDRKSVV